MRRMRGESKSDGYLWRNSLSGGENGMWGGHEVRKSTVSSRNGKEASRARACCVEKRGRRGRGQQDGRARPPRALRQR